MAELRARVEGALVEYESFPVAGVRFYDVLPLLRTPALYAGVVEWCCGAVPSGATAVVSPESRGFFLGCPVALRLGLKFVPARKPAKTPGLLLSATNAIEYGQSTLCVQKDALDAADRVVVIDDVLATGGTVSAICNILDQAGARLDAVIVLLNLTTIPKSIQPHLPVASFIEK